MCGVIFLVCVGVVSGGQRGDIPVCAVAINPNFTGVCLSLFLCFCVISRQFRGSGQTE